MRIGRNGLAFSVICAATLVGSAAQAQIDNGPGRSASGRSVGSVPSDALARCQDGTYVSSGSRASACSRHGGLKIWYADGPETATDADYAAPPAGRTATKRKVGGVPSDALGLCQDGTYVSSGSKSTACAAHGGMQIWYPDGTPNG